MLQWVVIWWRARENLICSHWFAVLAERLLDLRISFQCRVKWNLGGSDSPFVLLYNSDPHVCWVFIITNPTSNRDGSPEMMDSMESCVKSLRPQNVSRKNNNCSNHFTIRPMQDQFKTAPHHYVPFSSALELNMLARTPTLGLLSKKTKWHVYLSQDFHSSYSLSFLFLAPLFVATFFRNTIYSWWRRWVNARFIYLLFIGWSCSLMMILKLWQEEGKSIGGWSVVLIVLNLNICIHTPSMVRVNI